MGRFLNADAFASTGQGVLGNNMFAYCNNNPVCLTDPHGYASQITLSDKEDILTMPWKDSMGGGGIYVAQGYVLFLGAKYTKDEDWRAFFSSVEQLLESSSISSAIEAFKQLNNNEVYRYAKAEYKVFAGISQVKTAMVVSALPDPLPSNEVAAIQLLGFGISNIVVGAFQILERMINE